MEIIHFVDWKEPVGIHMIRFVDWKVCRYDMALIGYISWIGKSLLLALTR